MSHDHIVVISTSFPDVAFQAGQEAAGAFVYDFVTELARHVQVTAVVPGSRTKTEQSDGLTIRYFSAPSLPLSLLKPTNPTQWIKILQTLCAGQRMVNEAIAHNKVDHIFALWALPSGYWARRAGQRYKVPYSIWALGSDIWSLGEVPLVRTVLKSVLRDSWHRFADGYQLAADVEALSELDCKFLPSSRKLPVVEEKQLAVSPPYTLAFLGRWHPNKGVDLLLESLHALREEDWQKIEAVRICGGGPLEELVHEQCKWLQENGRPVTVQGYLNRMEATDLLEWADYLLLPSRVESIPVIFSDAMQTNCPVVAMPVGDLPRLMEKNKIGVLADSVRSSTYTHAVQKALEIPPATFESGLADTCAQFNINASVVQLLIRLNRPPQ